MKPEREIYFGWLTAMFAAGLGYLIEFLHKAITAYTDLSLWSPVSTSLPLYRHQKYSQHNHHCDSFSQALLVYRIAVSECDL